MENNYIKHKVFDFLDEIGGYDDYNGKVEALMDEFNLTEQEAEYWIDRYVLDPEDDEIEIVEDSQDIVDYPIEYDYTYETDDILDYFKGHVTVKATSEEEALTKAEKYLHSSEFENSHPEYTGISNIKIGDSFYKNESVNELGEAELSARQKERKLRNSKDIKKIFEDGIWEVWVPQSFAGSCKLGKGTEWRTADSRTDDYYYEYTEQGPLYVFINKQNPKEKYQLHVETESFTDRYDNEADLEDVLATDDKLNVFVHRYIYDYKIGNNDIFIYNGRNQVPESATSVIVKQGVKSIGNSAFSNRKSLQSVIIPDSVKDIGNYAFENCTSLQFITIPDSVVTIGGGAFFGCDSLKSITIPNSVTTIYIYAFYKCTSLQSVTIPNSVTTIGSYVFGFCESLQSIVIPNSVVTIGGGAFKQCDNLKEVILRNPNTKYEDNTFPENTKIIKNGMEESKLNVDVMEEDNSDVYRNAYVHKYSIPYRICVENDYGDSEGFQYPPHCDYMDDCISKAVEDFNDSNMHQYIPEDMRAVSAMMYPTDDNKRLMIEIKTMIELDDHQLEDLHDWIIGQMSDGWGEGFEQRELDRYTETEYIPYYDEDEDGNEIEYEEEEIITYYVYGQVWWSEDESNHGWSLNIVCENQ